MGTPPPPQRSPDGRWQWDGTRWIPVQLEPQPAQPIRPQQVPPPAPGPWQAPGYGPPYPGRPQQPGYGAPRPAAPARRSGRGPLFAVLGVVLAVVVVGGSVGGFLLLRRGGSGGHHPGPTVQGAPWGTPETVTAAMRKQGLACGQSLVYHPATQVCFIVEQGKSVVVRVTTAGDRVSVRASGANLDPDVKTPAAAFAEPYLAGIVKAVSDGRHRAAAFGWYRANATSQSANRDYSFGSEGDFQLSVGGSDDGETDLEASVQTSLSGQDGLPQPENPDLPNVTDQSGQAFFTGAGMSCDPPDSGVFCSATASTYYTEGSTDDEDSQPDDVHYTVTGAQGDLSAVITPRFNQYIPQFSALVFTEPSDQQVVTAWLKQATQTWSPNAFNLLIVKGISVELLPFHGGSTPGDTSEYGWRVDLEPTGFTG